MKLSVQTSPILDVFGIDKGFGMIADAGFDSVDFNIDHTLPGSAIHAHKTDGFYSQTDAQMLAALKPYADALKAHGVSVAQAHAPFPSYVHGGGKMNEYVLHAIQKCMMLLAEVGCPWLVVHPAFNPYGPICLTPDEEWKLNEELYSALIPTIRETGVRVATENMFSSYKKRVIEAVMSNARFAADFVDHMNAIAGEKLFGFCYDSGHVGLLHLDPSRFIETLGERISVLHLHDNDGVSDQHIFPYEGIIDWDGVCASLKKVGYKGAISFETFNGIALRGSDHVPQLLALLHSIGVKFAEKIEG